MKPQFTIRFAGKNIKPESFTVEDTQNLLGELRAAFRDVGRTDVSLSLVSITRRSAAYGFASPDVSAANTALIGIVDSLSMSSGALNAGQRRVSDYFERVNRDKQCQTVFYNAERKMLFTYRNKALHESGTLVFKEYASVIGKVIRAGGTGKPSAELFCSDGRKIVAYGDESQIKYLGQRLYEDVRLEGPLCVDGGSVKIDSIKSIFCFEGRGIADIFSELREDFGDKLNLGNEVDPIKYQRSIRG